MSCCNGTSCSTTDECSPSVFTLSVMTPFTRELGVKSPLVPTPAPKYNYTDYDVFCLKSKIYPYIRMLSSSFYPIFVFYEYLGEMRMFMELYENGDFHSMNSKEQQFLQEKVDYWGKTLTKHFLLIDGNVVKNWNGITLPQHWLQAIISYLPIDGTYDPHVIDSRIYITCNP